MRFKKKDVLQTSAIFMGILLLVEYLTALLLITVPLQLNAFKQASHIGEIESGFLAEWITQPIHLIQTAFTMEQFTRIQPYLISVLAVLFIRKLWLKRQHKVEDASKYGAHGTASWAKPKEIFKPHNMTDNLFKSGQLVGIHKKKPVAQSLDSYRNGNTLLIAGSGSRKSRAGIIPNILKTTHKSMVVTDPKGELFEQTSKAKKEQGYEVRVINFKNTEQSDRHNYFDYVRSDIDARKVALTIISNSNMGMKSGKDAFWDKAEASLLSALILYVKYHLPEKERHFGSVAAILSMEYNEIEKLFADLPKQDTARVSFDLAMAKLSDKVRDNVYVSLGVTMNLWVYPEIQQFTYESDFQLNEVGQKKMIVYIIIPIADETMTPLISAWFSQLFQELYRLADENGRKLPIPVWLMLDEFSNIGKIPKYTEYLSTTRSHRIDVIMAIQSIDQMKDRWGKEQTGEIFDNCDTRIFLGTNSNESANYFSESLGKTTVKVQSESGNRKKGKKEGWNSSVISRSLLTPDELLGLDEDTAIVFAKGSKPMKLQKADYSYIPDFQKYQGKKYRAYVSDYEAPERSEYQAFTNPKDDLLERMNNQAKDFMENEKMFIDYDIVDKKDRTEEENRAAQFSISLTRNGLHWDENMNERYGEWEDSGYSDDKLNEILESLKNNQTVEEEMDSLEL